MSTAEARFLSLYVSKLQQTDNNYDLLARQTAQTFYATVKKPTVPAFFQAVEAARLVHAAADTVQLEAAMAALFSSPSSSSSSQSRSPKKGSHVSKQGDHYYSASNIYVSSVMTAQPHTGATTFIIDTGCSSDIIVPDRSYLDGSSCDEIQESMPAFDGYQVLSQGTGKWCGLPALVCVSAPPLLNPSALCRLYDLHFAIDAEGATLSTADGSILENIARDASGLLRVPILSVRRHCLALKAQDGVVESYPAVTFFAGSPSHHSCLATNNNDAAVLRDCATAYSHVPDGYKSLLKLPPDLHHRFGRVVELIDQEKIRTATHAISLVDVTVDTFNVSEAQTVLTPVPPPKSTGANTATSTVEPSQSAPPVGTSSPFRPSSRSPPTLRAKTKSTVKFKVDAEPTRSAVSKQYTIESCAPPTAGDRWYYQQLTKLHGTDGRRQQRNQQKRRKKAIYNASLTTVPASGAHIAADDNISPPWHTATHIFKGRAADVSSAPTRSSYTNVYAVFVDADQSDDEEEVSAPIQNQATAVIDHLDHLDKVHPRPCSSTPSPRIVKARQIFRLLGSPMVETVTNKLTHSLPFTPT
jgi:hypothetical protein